MSAIEAPHRPVALVFVYTWDVVRALLALLAAVASFSDGVMVGSRVIPLPLWQQLLSAISAACYAAALFVIGVLLPRRAAWVRRAQITVFAISATLAVTSVGLQSALAPHAIEAAGVSFTLLFAGLYLAGIVAMLGTGVRAYFRGPGATPRYLIGLVGFWCCTQAGLTVLHAGS